MSRLSFFLTMFVAIGGFPCFAGADAAAGRPNIILIMADDLGYGDLGCYGQRLIETPHLDRMADEGMRFTDFYAGSTVCAPSRCVLMTGLHTGHCYIRGNGKFDLRPADVTVAEILRDRGYVTALCGKWGLGHEGSTGVPTRQGFDHFFGYLDQGHAHNYYPSYLVRNEERVPLSNVVPNERPRGSGVASEKREYSHDLITKDALQFVDENCNRPFFLYLSWTIPHANNEAGRAGMEVPDLGIYSDRDWPEPQKGHAAMISRMDADVGRLFARLKQHGIDERTLVLFTSDNGPHREGGNNPDFADSNGQLSGIKRDLTEGGIRVPLLARWPGVVKPSSTSDFVGGFQDVLPTLAELADVTDSADQQAVPADIDGLSFAPTLTGRGEQRAHDYLYWIFYERRAARALRRENWKIVEQPLHSAPRLYDLASDIGEQNDLAAGHPERTAHLTQLMDAAYTPSNDWRLPVKENGDKDRR